MKLRVNLISEAGILGCRDSRSRLILIPRSGAIKKHRIGDVEAPEICRRREELRAEAARASREGGSQEGSQEGGRGKAVSLGNELAPRWLSEFLDHRCSGSGGAAG